MATKYVILRNMLGNREQGWALFNGKEVVEMTSKEIKKPLENGEDIKGLVIDGDELVADEKGFYVTNIMEHRQVNSYSPMNLDAGNFTNVFYIVLSRNSDKVFEVISTKWERTTFSEDKVKTFIELGIISAGAKLVNGKVVLPGEEVKNLSEDKKSSQAKK